MNIVYVFVGGGLGSVLRYIIGLSIQRTAVSLPVATFIANLLACLIFAMVLNALKNRPELHQQMQLLLITGFCGGLSTFSTFGYETFLLLKQQLFLYATLNIILSVSLCVLIFLAFHYQSHK